MKKEEKQVLVSWPDTTGKVYGEEGHLKAGCASDPPRYCSIIKNAMLLSAFWMLVCIKIECFEISSKKGRFRDIIFRMPQEPRTDIIQWGSNFLGEEISSLVCGGSQQDSGRGGFLE